MKYELPKLPYEYDALEPVISKKTIEFHYGKHEQTYINNLNNLTKGTPYEDTPIETIIKEADGALFNNASQAWNHIFYFFSFTPHKSEGPKGALAKAIDEKWGSFEAFKKAFVDVGVAQFGSGWVWLVKDKDGKLDIIKEGNAGNPMTKTKFGGNLFLQNIFAKLAVGQRKQIAPVFLLPRLSKSKSRSFEWSMGYHRLESS